MLLKLSVGGVTGLRRIPRAFLRRRHAWPEDASVVAILCLDVDIHIHNVFLWADSIPVEAADRSDWPDFGRRRLTFDRSDLLRTHRCRLGRVVLDVGGPLLIFFLSADELLTAAVNHLICCQQAVVAPLFVDDLALVVGDAV